MLARPRRLARTDGSPKTPLPIIQFTTRAAMLQRPIARTSPSWEAGCSGISGTGRLYQTGEWSGKTWFRSSRIPPDPRSALELPSNSCDELRTSLRIHCRWCRLHGTAIDSATAGTRPLRASARPSRIRRGSFRPAQFQSSGMLWMDRATLARFRQPPHLYSWSEWRIQVPPRPRNSAQLTCLRVWVRSRLLNRRASATLCI